VIGSVIDKYEVLQKLGEGATATVYRGRHISIGRDVAIKVLHPHLSASTRYRERFNREARAVGRLAHENIVSILDYSGQTADDCYIVTELVDGSTLLALLEENGPFPSEIVAMLGIELCAALSFAHASGIIHRDLKPENVMLRRDGRVKLMDFGVARVLDDTQITLDGSLLGSPAYMSPQQALDEKLDGRSDLFSLGTVLFHAVTGRVPFAGNNASVILRNIIDGVRAEVLEVNPAVAPGLAAVIDRLLQPRPEDRYPTAEAAATALQAVLAEAGVPPEHPTINLRSWLQTPQGTTATLDTHLRGWLLGQGKTRLSGGDTVGALQLFNRLLAIDPDNAEVLGLIQALHGPPRSAPRPSWIATAAAAVLLLFGVGAWQFYPRDGAPSDPDGEAGAGAPRTGPTAAGEKEPAGEGASVAASGSLPSIGGESLPESVDDGGGGMGDAAEGPGVVSTGDTPAPSGARPRARFRLATTEATGTGGPESSAASTASITSTAPTASSPVASTPGTLTLELRRPAEVWLDGKKLGSFRSGARETWIGTRDRPIELSPGTHTLKLTNPGAIDFVEEFSISAGEARVVRAELAEKPTPFVINSRVPRDCELTVGTTPYGPISGFKGVLQITSPDPSARAVFVCPGKGRFEFPLPPTRAGTETPLPTAVPAGML
jgi:serine/threonine-protein kinase